MSFQQYIRTIPQINPNYWSFAITGKVRHPLILSLADLYSLPTQAFRCALTCSATNTQLPLIYEADWRGVSLPTLLERISIDPSARYAHIHAADGYTTILPLDALVQTTLVYEMNGAPLPPAHGFPARLIAPGLHGYKMPKWITRIELGESPKGGFWEARGWSLDGRAGAQVRILSAEPVADGSIELAGIAYAGVAEIASLRVSIDSAGAMVIPFTSAEPFRLTHWRTHWMPPGVGDYMARVDVEVARPTFGEWVRYRNKPIMHTMSIKVR
ncbi:MAG: molybdopterin-dependent oxidoreductase [Chloroflexota bacterium]